MGILTEAVKALVQTRSARQAVAATVPIGLPGVPATPPHSYERNAREGYMRDELVYACCEMRATSAAEPRLVAYRGDEKIDDHPLLDLWNRPNRFQDRFGLTASVVMYRDVGGNAFIEKVRSGAGKMVELWTMRPDRVRVIPDAQTYIGGYQYQLGAYTYELPAADVVHVKSRHPLDDFYGLPILAPLAGRVDLDNWTRDFVRAFFTNAAVPAGMLNVKRMLNDQERELIRARLRRDYGGPAGWHNVLLIDGDEATYDPMGLPLGARGAAVPEIDEANEARICGAFGVPPSLVGTRIGMNSSSYANRKQDEENFWMLTLMPLYRDIAADLTTGFGLGRPDGDFPDIDRVEFDLSDVKALAEDVDALHKRIIGVFQASIITHREARVALGYAEEPEKAEGDFYVVPANMAPTPIDQVLVSELPEPTPEDQAAADGSGDYAGTAGTGRTNGRAR